MLKLLHLINWRSHADTKLEFKAGTNLLMGIMGSGKSSILSAVCFSFFGTFPELERRKVKLEQIIRLHETTACVVLEFKWKNDIYRVERIIEKEKIKISSDATIYKNGAVVEKGAVAVTTYIEELLSITYDLFTRAIYSEQNNIDYFLTLDPKRRKEEIDALLGLDTFEIARANSVTAINRIKSDHMNRQADFTRMDQEKNRKNYQECLEKQKQIGEKNEAGLKSIIELQEKLQTAKKQYAELQSKKQAHELLTKQLIRIQSVIESLKKEVGTVSIDESQLEQLRIKKINGDKRKNEIDAEYKIIEQEEQILRKQVASTEHVLSEANKADEEIKKLGEEVAKMTQGILIHEAVKKVTSEIEQCQTQLVNHRSEKTVLENELKELRTINETTLKGTNCPLCGTALEEHRIPHIIAERKGKISLKEIRLGELQVQAKVVQDAYEKKTYTLKTIEHTMHKIDLLKLKTQKKEEYKQELVLVREKEGAKKKQREELHELREKTAYELHVLEFEIAKLEALLKKRNEFIELGKKESELKTQVETIVFDEKQYEVLQRTVQELEIAVHKLEYEKISYEKELQSIEEMSALLKKAIETAEVIEKEIKHLALLEEELSIFRSSLLETQITLRNTLIEAINAALNEIWGIFYPYGDYKALRLAISEKDYSFEIFDGVWKILESVASGGERACAALTLRVAFAMVLTPNLSILMLDEPTHNLDKQAVELLSQTLQFKVPEVIEQTIVITHEESLMGSEFASSYRLARNKEKHEATKVERI